MNWQGHSCRATLKPLLSFVISPRIIRFVWCIFESAWSTQCLLCRPRGRNSSSTDVNSADKILIEQVISKMNFGINSYNDSSGLVHFFYSLINYPAFVSHPMGGLHASWYRGLYDRYSRGRDPDRRSEKSYPLVISADDNRSQSNWLVNARSPLMWVTVLASHPSESIPTDMIFLYCSPGFPIRTCKTRRINRGTSNSLTPIVEQFYEPVE